MSKKSTAQPPIRGISSEKTMSSEEQTIPVIEELISGENKYKSIVDSVFWLFNDLKKGGRFDELLEMVRRLKEFLFIPENNQAFCKGFVMLEPGDLYNLLDKLHDFVEEIYSYQGDTMLALDLFELKEYPGQIPEVRVKDMLENYAVKLEIKKAKTVIEENVKARFNH